MRTRTHRAAGLLALVLSVSVVASACGSDSESSSGAGLSAATLNQSGATFQLPFLQEVAAQFKEEAPSITLNVSGGGSGKGRQDLADQVTEVAASDGLPKTEDLPKFKGGELLYFPTVSAPITVSYNVSGVDGLKLDADTTAKIFQRDIKTWDDAAIKALNSGVTLPSTPIVVAHRSDSSGTTENFTKYLKAAAPSVWKLDAGSTVQWPADTQAGAGNAGVAQIVKDTNGAVGYVDFSDAKALTLKFADMKNKAGEFITPSLEGTTAALEGVTINDDLSYNPLNAEGADSYPIAAPTWVIVYKNQTDKAEGEAIKALLEFIYADGQDLANEIDYAKLSDPLLDKSKTQIDQIVVPA